MRRGPDFIAKWIGKTPYIRSLSQNAPARVDLIEICGLQHSVEDRCLKEGMGAVATRAKGAEAPILKTTLYKQGNTVHLFPKTKNPHIQFPMRRMTGAILRFLVLRNEALMFS